MREFDAAATTESWNIDIPTMLDLTKHGPDIFRAHHCQRNVYRGIFGGQLVAQALAAADYTAPDRVVHSLHCYFLRAGDQSLPIDYHVERVRDGGRFSTRRVVARQADDELLILDCSYRSPIQGFSHYLRSEVAFDPENALTSQTVKNMKASDGEMYPALFAGVHPVELRIPGPEGFLETGPDARRHYWLRAPGAERVESKAVQRQILAFLSDFMFAGVPLMPHTVPLPGPKLFVASLDHNIWFHRDVRCDDWLLFETDGPNAENGVNLARGLIYNRNGELVATIVQEALQVPVDVQP